MLQGNSGTSKIRVLLSGTPHPNSGADVVVNETRRRSSLRITPTTVERVVAWMHKVYYTLVDCNPVTPLLRFVLDSLYNLFLHRCAAVSTDASRGPSAVAELLVFLVCFSIIFYVFNGF